MHASKFLPVLIIALLHISGCNFSPVKQDTSQTSTPVETAKSQTSETNSHESSALGHRGTENDLKYSEFERAASGNSAKKTPALTSNADLWREIADNLEFPRHINQNRVKQKVEWFARNQAYLDRVAERADPYLFHIVSELKRRNMPLDLALLPIVESAYQPFALSPSRAAGLWQFIPATGKRYGLKQNWWYDGRRDVVAATDSALKYLSDLNKRFNGNWFHAVAAYNTGERNVERSIERNQRSGKATDFWSLRLHRETQQYLPNLLAIAEIVANPAKYNVKLKPIANQAHFKMVDTGGQIDLATVSELSNLDMDRIYKLNPAFNRWATAPDGPHRILLPIRIADTVGNKLKSLPKEERIRWQQHVIKSGDTLGGIAQRYGSSVTALKQANGLKSHRIRAGRSLLIPVAKQPLDKYTLSQHARLYRGLKRGRDGKSFVYKIKRGDTLWDIGRLYGVSVKQLCRWNSISPRSTLRLGQKISIQVADNEQGSQGTLVKASDNTSEGAYAISYQVQNGDSLWLISRKFGVSVNQLMNWNNLKKGRYLKPGQNLTLYTDKKPAGA